MNKRTNKQVLLVKPKSTTVVQGTMTSSSMANNTTIIDISQSSSLATNTLLLERVRIIVKFYIWPLLALFGLTGNCLSILVLTRRRLIRTSTNNYLTILAAFDSCYLISTLILNFGSHSTFAHNTFIQTLLHFIRPFADFSSNTATWLIVCFTLERTLAVARPIYAKRTCSVRRSRRLICTVLVICFLITLPTFLENRLEHKDKINKQRVNRQDEFFFNFYRLYLVFICVVIIWIPLLLLCICNSILIWYVHRSRRFADDLPITDGNSNNTNSSVKITKPEYSSQSYQKSFSSSSLNNSTHAVFLRRHSRSYFRKRKVTIVLIFCLFVALLLWTPQSLSLTYEILIKRYSDMSSEDQIVLLIFNNFANLFLCMNASIDFILYCFLSEKFARTFKQMICRQCTNRDLVTAQRNRMVSLDHTSILNAGTSTLHHQQQLAAKTTNCYYAQLYNFYRHASGTSNSTNTKWENKIVRSPSAPNTKCDTKIIYQTALLRNKQKSPSTTKTILETIEKQQPQIIVKHIIAQQSIDRIPNIIIETSDNNEEVRDESIEPVKQYRAVSA